MGRGINPKYNKLDREKIKKRRGSTPSVVDMNYGPLRKNTTLTRLYEIWDAKDKQTQEERGDRLGVLTTGVRDEDHQYFIITIRKKNGLEEFL